VSRDAARQMLDGEVSSGRALAKFREMVAAQHGNLDHLPPIPQGQDMHAELAGYVLSINTEQIGLAIIELGGGRKVLADSIDHAVGLEMFSKIGDRVEHGQPLLRVFGQQDKVDAVRGDIVAAFAFSDQPVPPLPLIVERIE